MAAILMATGMPVFAQTTVSLNLDYAEGKFGESTKSTSWTAPLIIKHQMGDFGLKLNLPYVRASGTAAVGGDRFSATKQTQEGMGDTVATATYETYTDIDSGLAVDVGVKAKFATADKKNDLITTGKNDYSLLVDVLRPIGRVTPFVTLGWTKKGSPDGEDFRDPWFSTVGVSYKFSDDWTAGAVYDYRQKVTSSGAPISEATMFVETKINGHYRLQGYVVQGFSDASPDLGLGVTVSSKF